MKSVVERVVAIRSMGFPFIQRRDCIVSHSAPTEGCMFAMLQPIRLQQNSRVKPAATPAI